MADKNETPIERNYTTSIARLTKLEDYPDVDDATVSFPDHVHIAYAVCSKRCGRAEFIVDGGTQICVYCGLAMFRTAVKRYKLVSVDEGE